MASQSSAQIRLLLVEDVAQVSQYIRNLLAVQTQVKLLEVVTDGRQVLDQVPELGHRAQPFVVAAPDAQISKDIVRVAQALTGAMAPAVAGRKS